MRTRSRNPFTTVTTSGLLLPVDLLTRVVEGDPDLPGLSPKDYHLRSGERLNEAASRAWNECLACWKSFRKKFKALPASDAGTTLTRDEWLLPLFQELGYGRLQAKKAIEIEGKEYPISHGWENHVPIHLLSAKLPLDRRTPGVAGAATRAPYSLLQEQLNRSAQHRWGFVSNGQKLFMLRDNAALARAANVEFDLEAIMDGEVYSDFMLLFLLCHQSRVEILGSGGSDDNDQRANPEDCWLEQWANQADQQGTRARERLRDGVEAAIKALGAGFLTTKGNNELRDRLRTGDLATQDYYRQLLRVVYRLLMLLVAEEKKAENGQNLFHPPETPPEFRERYARFYSVGRIRSLAYERRGTAHTDLYESLKVLFLKLREGYTPLGIPGMGSFLFSDDSTPDLDDSLLANQDLLDAFRQLCYTEDTSGRGSSVRRPVDFGNLGSEELGSVYESLLELHPQIDTDAGPFTLGTAAGHERKTTGSYYTPRSLINCLLDSALDPVVNEAIDVPDPAEAEQKLLDLKVCDPACGSGHFLIAAAERMATHLARLRTGDDQPNTLDVQHAKRDIIGRCIYGVDINPMAVELCKVSLWMEALEPGKPLSFLDHHIQCGNSLLGTTPRLLAEGIPDDAFKPIEGDDKKICAELKKDNKKQRKDYEAGYRDLNPLINLGDLPQHFAKLTREISDTVEDTVAKAKRYAELVKHSSYENACLLADYWCAAFVWKKEDSDLGKLCPTERDYRKLQAAPSSILPHVKHEVQELADQYQFFHWHLAFPDVFQLSTGSDVENEQAGWNKGFDAIVGNPPWEKVKVQEREWFAASHPKIANARTAAQRRKLIAALRDSEPDTFSRFSDSKRNAEAMTAFFANSGKYPRGASGDMNTYPLFTETSEVALAPRGRAGIIVKTGILADYSMRAFFAHFMDKSRLVSAYDFSNKELIFPAVVANERFTLLTLCGSAGSSEAATISILNPNVTTVTDPLRRWTLSQQDVNYINPNTKTCPLFQNSFDASLVKSIYRGNPVLVREDESGHNRWGVSYYTQLHMSNDSGLFIDFETLQAESESVGAFTVTGNDRYVSLLEGKLFDSFHHRHGNFLGIPRDKRFGIKAEPNHPTVTELADANYQCLPRYWVSEKESNRRYIDQLGYVPSGLLVFRDVCRTHTDLRTVRATICPPHAAGNKAPILLFPGIEIDEHAVRSLRLCGAITSFVFDYVARQKFSGGSLNKYILLQLPVTEPESRLTTSESSLVERRVLELTYTAWDLEAFALDCGYDGTPFRWDEERRFQIRCELDAAYFHLYLGSDEEWGADNPTLREMFPTPRDAVDYIMDTFPIVRRKDITRTQVKNADGEVTSEGTYITKQTILKIYDQMAKAIRTGQPYKTSLDPPPGPPTDDQGNFIPYSEWTDAIRDQYASVIHIPAADVGVVVDDGILPEVSYPGVAAFDRSVCAAALRVVDQEPGIESPEHLDLLLLASHPEYCEPFLDESDVAQLDQLKGADTFPFRAEPGTSIRWKECRDYLEQRQALSVDRDTTRQPISKDSKFDDVQNEFDAEVEELVALAFKTMEVIRSLRGDLTQASVVQRRVIERLDKIRELYDLAA